jgi:hypothetical protein
VGTREVLYEDVAQLVPTIIANEYKLKGLS